MDSVDYCILIANVSCIIHKIHNLSLRCEVCTVIRITFIVAYRSNPVFFIAGEFLQITGGLAVFESSVWSK